MKNSHIVLSVDVVIAVMSPAVACSGSPEWRCRDLVRATASAARCAMINHSRKPGRTDTVRRSSTPGATRTTFIKWCLRGRSLKSSAGCSGQWLLLSWHLRRLGRRRMLLATLATKRAPTRARRQASRAFAWSIGCRGRFVSSRFPAPAVEMRGSWR